MALWELLNPSASGPVGLSSLPLRHFLPELAIHGTVLLLGGIGFALAQRPLWSPAP